jgi:hyperosmotically inducible periplasmic protein
VKTLIFLLIAVSGIAGCGQHSDTSTTSQTSAPDNTAVVPTTQPDNTAINTRDQTPGAITAGMAGQGKADVDIAADIRRQIMNGKMSVAAQNTKIICLAGKVTLRGPVNTQDEKDSVGNIANGVAGSSNVDNQLEVKPNS